MLTIGARRRVKEAVEDVLDPGEELHASFLATNRSLKDYAVGLTDRRLILVRVSNLRGKAKGAALTFPRHAVAQAEDNPPASTGLLVTVQGSNKMEIKMPDGTKQRLSVERMWWKDVDEMRHSLATGLIDS